MTYREVILRLPDQSCLTVNRRLLNELIALRVAREQAAARLRLAERALAERALAERALAERALAERALTVAATGAYEAGDSWLAIVTVLGISRQAAQQRYGAHVFEEADLPSDELAQP